MSTQMYEIAAKQYLEIVAQEAELAKRKKELREELFGGVDAEVGPGRAGAFQAGSYQVYRSIQETPVIDQEALKALLFKKAGLSVEEGNSALSYLAGHTEDLAWKEYRLRGFKVEVTVDEDWVANLIDGVYLTEEEFLACVSTKQTEKIRVVEVRGE